MLRIPCVVLLAVISLLATPRAASACSCFPPPPPLEAVEQADAVFLARITGVEEIEYNNSWLMRSFRKWVWDAPFGGYRPNKLRVTFNMVEAYKGVDGSDALLTTIASSSMCGYTGFETGRTFLIYASRHPDDGLRTGLCSRTALVNKAKGEIRKIREQHLQ